MPGQNSEEAAELVATIRGEHVVMKNWFMGPTKEAGALREKYGPYPGLWKEVLNWPGWKEARKAYLQFVQVKESNGHSQTGSGSNGVPRKRRTRWGSSSESDNDRNNPNGAPNQSGPPPDAQPPSKRRSRWGRDSATSAPAPAPAPAPATSVAGHYGPASASTSTPSLKPLPGLGLPGMPTNLSPQQQNEFQRHQARLREVNEKLDNLDREAARVDALPRGHRDRSPSPPPGKFFFPNRLSKFFHVSQKATHSTILFLRFAYFSFFVYLLYVQSTAPMVSVRTRARYGGDSATLQSDRIFWKS